LSEPLIIDCLEFNRAFRLLDPAEELSFLAMECDLIGAPEVGTSAFDIYAEITGDRPPPSLIAFYKSFRAFLRARIAICHLKDEHVRLPEKWPRQAKAYLGLAENYRLAAP
jgi:aminoglycoside phosphotransferase family enzyme